MRTHNQNRSWHPLSPRLRIQKQEWDLQKQRRAAAQHESRLSHMTGGQVEDRGNGQADQAEVFELKQRL